MVFFSFMVSEGTLNPNLILFLDAVFVFHCAIFVMAVTFFIYHGFFKSNEQKLMEQSQSIQDRKVFLERLEDLKRKEQNFKKGQSILQNTPVQRLASDLKKKNN